MRPRYRRRRGGRAVGASACLLALAACVGILLAGRRADGLPSVDDHLYTAGQGLRGRPPARADRALHAWHACGPNSPLVGLLGAPVTTVSSSPFALLAVQVAICATLLAGILRCCSNSASPPGALVGAAATGLLPAVTDYVVMVSYTLAATSALVWCCVAYLRSTRLGGGGRASRSACCSGCSGCSGCSA